MTGELRALARKVWDVSDKTLNPRYLRGSYLFINRLKLLDKVDGVYRLGERGNRFLAHDEGILLDLDAVEGIPKLLSLVAERSPCKRGDILPAWSEYLKAVSLFSTPKTFVHTLRLINATARGLISREGNFYEITDAGLSWLKGFAGSADVPRSTALSPPSEPPSQKWRRELLGLPERFTGAELRRAWLRLVRELHPDRWATSP